MNSNLELFPDLERDLSSYNRGVLPYQHIRRLIEGGQLSAPSEIEEKQLQPSSLDLRLGPVAYQVRASFLPGAKRHVLDVADELTLQTLDLTRPTVLQRGAVYIVPLLEELSLPTNVVGKANPKSTIGRLDVFARLLADRGDQFDRVDRGYKGKLFVEVAPRSFSIQVHEGSTLNQMRFMRGTPSQSDRDLVDFKREETLVYGAEGDPISARISNGLWLTVDLKGGEGRESIGWRARRNAPVVDLDRINHYDPSEFWEPVKAQTKAELILNPDEFYILGSKERVRVPNTFAAEMVPYDPAMGEFRVHYAGFFDPGFGYGQGEVKGTKAVLEVRSHEVPYLLTDGQHIGRLIYERLLEVPEKVYGAGAGSSYQHQDVGLSKQFRTSDRAATSVSPSANP